MSQALYANLLAARPTLPAKDQPFADSLLAQYERGRPWSDKQAYWAKRLCGPAPKATKVVESLQPILDAIARATRHLKKPGFRFALNERTPLRIYPAGPSSRNAGQLYVVGDVSGDRRYFGRLDQQGVFHPADHAEGVEAALARFARDPVGQAREYARLFGRCCFCNIELTDERSTEVGYGPVCAKHYGLPWTPTEVENARQREIDLGFKAEFARRECDQERAAFESKMARGWA